MSGAVIIDIIVAAVLALFIWRGKRKGLFASLASLLVVIVAFVGAGFIASEFSDDAAEWTRPLIEEKVAEKLDAAIEESGSEKVQPTTVFAVMGLDNGLVKKLSAKVEEEVAETGADIVSAMLHNVLQAVAYQALFFLTFAALCLALNFLVKSLDLVLRLPVLRFFNSLGGAAFGLIEGALLLFAAFWVLRFLGLSLPEEWVEKSCLTWIFVEKSPLALLAWL